MYAIVEAGGRQVRVTPGSVVLVDRVAGDTGQDITLDRVLLVQKDGGEIVTGAPFVANARVLAVVDAAVRGPKIRVFKKKRRKGYRRTRGHRSALTRLRVKEIQA